MKKIFFLILGFIIFVNVSYSQENISRDNTLSFTIAPSLLYNSHFVKPKAETFLPTGASLLVNFKSKKRTSFSTGVHILYESYSTPGFISIDGVYTGPMQTIDKVRIFGIPVRLNYLLTNSNKKMSILLNSTIENSFIIDHYERKPDLGMNPNYKDKTGYNLFIGVGAELDIKIADKLSFVFEPGAKYPLMGWLTQMGLFDFQFGLKYNLTQR